MEDRYFSVSCHNCSYTVLGNENTTLETVWASQKCFFMYSTAVTIEDNRGNKKTFVA